MSRFARSIICLAACILLASITPALAQDLPKEVHIGTEGAFAPWNFSRPDGSLAGFEIDLATELCKRMKLSCTFTAQAFDGLIPALNAGKIDAIMAAMSVTEKRKEVIAFTNVYASSGQAFGTIKGNALEGLPDNGIMFALEPDSAAAMSEMEKLKPLLKGKTIGVQAGAISDQFMKKYFGDVVQLRGYKSTEQHDLDLVAGRIDAVFASPVYLMTSMKKPGNEDIVMAGPRFRGGVLGAGSAIGLRKADTALKDAFDAAIKGAKDDGTVPQLATKWFGIDISMR
jgi:octopine/nopaline transport system substrate-binding protein